MGKSKELVKLCLKQCWTVIICLIICNTLIGYVDTLRTIIDSIWKSDYYLLMKTTLYFVCLAVIQFILYAFNRILTFQLRKKVNYIFEDTFCTYLTNLCFWEKSYCEVIFGQLRNNIPELVESSITFFVSIYQILITIVLGSIYALSLNYLVFISCFIITLIMLFVLSKPLSKLPALFDKFVASENKMYNMLWEQVNNREISRTMDVDKVIQNYDTEAKEYIDGLLQIKKISNSTSLFSVFGSIILILVIGLVGGILVFNGKLIPADVLAFIMVIPNVASNLFQIPEKISIWRSIKGKYSGIKEVLSHDTYVSEGKIKSKEHIEQLSINNLKFQYANGVSVLGGISVTFESGKFYSITGESGCGKSTLIKIIAQLLPYQNGTVRYNQHHLNTVERISFWSKIGYFSQEASVCSGNLGFSITI